ncbi:MAG: diacylglycerol O-acyltransferase / wax synthase [Thermoleophilaceae bacterium]|nr:diacylglycerol O-acyltransferase / wax synthase [Thermoleophilaceae bacterium]MEA2388174.1 diacylglycerol O-acyltransferase / wax synthase [Thermoleophilaceae bacterium]
MAKLSSLDASFLRVETPTAHMHVGWLSLLDLPAGAPELDAESVAARIAARLHLAPRFRQRLAVAPLALGTVRWEDDPAFDVSDHVTAAPGPCPGQAQLRRLADDFLSEQLPRDRPLWSLLVVPSVGGRRAALLGKVHHALVDGLAAVELGMLLFDLAPDAASPEPADWQPSPGMGSVRLALDSVADSALEQFRAARAVASLGLSPGRGLRVADSVRRAAMSVAEDALRPAPSSYLNVPIGPRRTLVRHRVALSRLLRIKTRTGATLNDVLLTVTGGALRRLAVASSEAPCDLRVMVPVSVRSAEQAREGGNRITFAFVDLPVTERDPARALARIRAQTTELKTSGRVAGSDLLLRSLGALPEPLQTSAARLAASPRLYNLTISNVPGPRVPLYVGGARVRSTYPVIPIPDRHALAVGILTYDDAAHFAAYADPVALPAASRLPMMLADSIEELAIGAGVRHEHARPARRPAAYIRGPRAS